MSHTPTHLTPTSRLRHRPRILLLDNDDHRRQRKKNAIQRCFPTVQIVDAKYLHQAAFIRQKLDIHLLLIEQPLREYDFSTIHQLQQNEPNEPIPLILSLEWHEITQRPSFSLGAWNFLRTTANTEELCSSLRPLLSEPPPFPEMTGPLHPTALPNLIHSCGELRRHCVLRIEGFLFFGGLWFQDGQLIRAEYKMASPAFLGDSLQSIQTFDLQGEKALSFLLSSHQGRFFLRDLSEPLPLGLHNIARVWDPLKGLTPTEHDYMIHLGLSASYDALPAEHHTPLHYD
ncbi:DUF4388 domain-containing protein [Myxococcota bacterium]|nr:DUF4388 domain-containing protein [Myxococcota bacterium]